MMPRGCWTTAFATARTSRPGSLPAMRPTLRQRPQTASGVTFLTMEDEHGLINVIVWRDVADTYRRVLLESHLLGVDGKWEMLDGVCHLVASRLLNMTSLLCGLDVRSRDFHWVSAGEPRVARAGAINAALVLGAFSRALMSSLGARSTAFPYRRGRPAGQLGSSSPDHHRALTRLRVTNQHRHELPGPNAVDTIDWRRRFHVFQLLSAGGDLVGCHPAFVLGLLGGLGRYELGVRLGEARPLGRQSRLRSLRSLPRQRRAPFRSFRKAIRRLLHPSSRDARPWAQLLLMNPSASSSRPAS
jgi:hypothetical protein